MGNNTCTQTGFLSVDGNPKLGPCVSPAPGCVLMNQRPPNQFLLTQKAELPAVHSTQQPQVGDEGAKSLYILASKHMDLCPSAVQQDINGGVVCAIFQNILSTSTFFPDGWEGDLMPGTSAAILDYEVEVLY